MPASKMTVSKLKLHDTSKETDLEAKRLKGNDNVMKSSVLLSEVLKGGKKGRYARKTTSPEDIKKADSVMRDYRMKVKKKSTK
jgi:hypothetical protein